MELSDFVQKTLEQIITGVEKAQTFAKDHKAEVNPRSARPYQTEGIQRLYDREVGGLVAEVDFDVALTNTEGTKTEGGIGVFLGAVGLGAKGESMKDKSSLSRVKFAVPVRLPVQ